jgi:hypothetical protein
VVALVAFGVAGDAQADWQPWLNHSAIRRWYFSQLSGDLNFPKYSSMPSMRTTARFFGL